MKSAIPLLLFLLALPVKAQQRRATLQIGAVHLRLGMEKADVIAKFTEAGYDLSNYPKLPWLPEGTEEWGVGHKDSRGGFIPDALVDFRAGALWRAGKEWYGAASTGNTGADLAEALYGLAQNLKYEHVGLCALDARNEASAELGETKHVALVCGPKLVDVSVFEAKGRQVEKGRPGVSVWEYLAPRDDR